MPRMNFPHLRFCVNSVCNFSCKYCKRGGESGYCSDFGIGINDIRSLLEIIHDSEIRSIKFTGGEPLLRKGIIEILAAAKSVGMENIQMVTNGYHLEKFAGELKEIGLEPLSVSLDAISRKKFLEATGKDSLNRVVAGIQMAHNLGIPLRINTVLTKINISELPELINFSITVDAEIKLLDLLEFQVPTKEYWEKNFVTLRDVAKMLKQHSIKTENVPGEGGYGVPMTRFHLKNGARILVKDSCTGTHYARICKSCDFFPCQDGLYGLKIAHDGKIKICWPRNDINMDFLDKIKAGKRTEAIYNLNKALTIFQESKFYPKAWIKKKLTTRPSILKESSLIANQIKKDLTKFSKNQKVGGIK